VLEVHSQGAAHFALVSSNSSPTRGPPSTPLQRRLRGEGRVRNMTDFGAFIEIEEGIDGLVHVSDLSWTKRISILRVLKKGQTVQPSSGHRFRAHRLSLGVSNCSRMPGRASSRPTGGRHVARARYAAWPASALLSSLAEGVEGLCHFPRCGLRRQARRRIPAGVGQEYDFKIVKMSEAEKKIVSACGPRRSDEEKTRLEDYQRLAAAATHTIRRQWALKEPEPK